MGVGQWIKSRRTARQQRNDMAQWQARAFAAPSPPFIKRAVLARHSSPQATWVETGTFQGDTTAFLADRARKVISIEPGRDLYAAVVKRFKDRPNVELHNALSEEAMPAVVKNLSGDVCFWLDGHYSAGFTHKGPKDTPVLEELALIGTALPQWGKVAVLVDDVRCFEPTNPEFADYPERQFLVNWAVQHGLNWTIEHDIFVAKNFR